MAYLKKEKSQETSAMDSYFSPSFLYPAASAYQLAIGVIMRLSHGRLTIKLARDGVDMTVCAQRENVEDRIET